jgi:hypothetical protein
MRLEEEAGEKSQTRSARHEIEVHNHGNVPYGEVRFRLVYLDRRGKVLASQTRSVAQGIMPGATLSVADIVVGDLPNAAVDCRVTIDYADLEPAPPSSR